MLQGQRIMWPEVLRVGEFKASSRQFDKNTGEVRDGAAWKHVTIYEFPAGRPAGVPRRVCCDNPMVEKRAAGPQKL
jgi:hypothetical protein